MKPIRVHSRLFAAVLMVFPAAADTFVLRNANIHTVSGPTIPAGSIVVDNGKIADVGAKVVTPKGARVIDLKGLEVYPGMIDSATEIGLTEIFSVREMNDISDLGLFKPQLRAAIAVNPASEHIPVTRAGGITTVVTMPGGGIICGQSALIHLDGWTTEDMTLRRSAAMQLDFPQIQSGGGFRGGRRGGGAPVPFAEARRRYEQQTKELDEFFDDARRYQRARTARASGVKIDLKLEAMLPVLEGKLPVLVRADRERTIREAIKFAGKQKIHMILQHADEAWKVASELKAAGIPVTLGPTQRLPDDEDDPYDKPFTTPGELFKAGVKFAFGTFGPTASMHPRNLPYQAAFAEAFGLPHEEALRAVTINAAQILGVGDQIGSIEKGKLADLIVTDGDPLEAKTQVKQVFIQGKSVDLDSKHYRLYQKYLNRP
jgi:imidazolonepropionase-like amidohydrolase